MKVQAKIYYKILPTHPDKDCVVGGWDPKKEYSFSDTYTFSDAYTRETAKAYAKRDLALVAGGGYNAEHITDIRYEWRWLG